MASPQVAQAQTSSSEASQASKKKELTRGKIAWILEQELKKKYFFARDSARILYVYEKGVYRPYGYDLLDCWIKEVMVAKDLMHRWDRELAKHVEGSLLANCPLLPRPTLNIINVLNGMLDLQTLTLKEHGPQHLSYIQIPIYFDPKAQCPEWDKFISEVFESDCKELVWELLGWLIRPDMSIQKAICLVGAGANGKSTFLDGVQKLIGEHNISSTSLHFLQQNRFASYSLVGKLANICADLPTRELEQSDIFKQLTGGDKIEGEQKYGRRFHFNPFARLVFSSNNPPTSRDASFAYYRRWLIIPFYKEFEPTSANYRPKNEIEASLFTTSELSGLFNHALEGIKRLEANFAFSLPESVQEAMAEFITSTNPLHRWSKDYIEFDINSLTDKESLINHYNLWRQRNRYDRIAPQVYFRELMKLAREDYGISLLEVRQGARGMQKRYLKGVKLLEAADTELIQERMI